MVSHHKKGPGKCRGLERSQDVTLHSERPPEGRWNLATRQFAQSECAPEGRYGALKLAPLSYSSNLILSVPIAPWSSIPPRVGLPRAFSA